MNTIQSQLSAEQDDSYNIIYADPPWSYNQQIGNGVLKKKKGDAHYSSMSIKQICDLGEDVKRICKKDSVLMLWATMPNLPQAFAVMHSWGFIYKTCFTTWIKTVKDGSRPSFGVGYYTRSNAELCLLGIRGKMATYKHVIDGEKPRSPNTMSSVVHTLHDDIPETFLKLATITDDSPVIIDPRREHSRKPSKVRQMIVQLFGDLPRLELFGREQIKGWCVLGNQTTKFDEQQALSEKKSKIIHKKKKRKIKDTNMDSPTNKAINILEIGRV